MTDNASSEFNGVEYVRSSSGATLEQIAEAKARFEQMKQQRAGLHSIKDIIADLSRPVNPQRLKSKPVGKGNSQRRVQYLPWHQVVRYLDYHTDGNWSYEIRSVQQIGDSVVVTARITIRALEGDIWREATGIEELQVRGYGDCVSNASSMALRRAAAHFGLCLSLYEK